MELGAAGRQAGGSGGVRPVIPACGEPLVRYCASFLPAPFLSAAGRA